MPLYAPPTPSGLMATPATSITSDTSITVEKLQLTYSFNAVLGRSYLLVFSEPSIFGSSSATMTARIRESTSAFGITGTVLNQGTVVIPTLLVTSLRCEVIYTALASGTFYIVATLQAGAGTGQTQRTSLKFPQFYALNVGVL